jgi:hypothetical protein
VNTKQISISININTYPAAGRCEVVAFVAIDGIDCPVQVRELTLDEMCTLQSLQYEAFLLSETGADTVTLNNVADEVTSVVRAFCERRNE